VVPAWMDALIAAQSRLLQAMGAMGTTGDGGAGGACGGAGGAGAAWYTLPVYSTPGQAKGAKGGKGKGKGKGGKKAGGLLGYGAQAARRLSRFLSKHPSLLDKYMAAAEAEAEAASSSGQGGKGGQGGRGMMNGLSLSGSLAYIVASAE
jgi:hypothetical protein